MSGAAGNSPTSCVLAGDPEKIDALLRDLEAEGIFGRRVQVDFASHSRQMDPLRAPLLDLLASIRPGPGEAPLYSTVTGRPLTGPEMDAAYWADNLREPVLFADAVQRLAEAGFDTFVEFSPHPLLARAVRQNLRHADRDATVVTVLTRETPGRAALLHAAAELYTTGREVDLTRIQPYDRHDVSLPSYPWQHERHRRHFRKAEAEKNRIRYDSAGHPITGTALRLAPGDHMSCTTASPRTWDVTSSIRRCWTRPSSR
ncbi:hypothetical protein GCM10010517_76160 [Streptosporangium fragile]|uniref:Malonyl-CoA:ACP transacylase (MAT) domain-containing protein n=1 Tax=Streptosporangium fragile TaxID=46186 RepID=A0ABN3WCB3_9ACTN